MDAEAFADQYRRTSAPADTRERDGQLVVGSGGERRRPGGADLPGDRTHVRLDRTTRVGSHPTSARVARRFVREVLDGYVGDDQLKIATLLVSELVTNSIQHAHSTIGVRVVIWPTTARVEVRDASPTLPVSRALTEDDTTGRGLWLVEHLASAWGWSVEADRSGKVMWFELNAS